MINLLGIYEAFLENMLSLSATMNTAATGSAFQVFLLRAMGVKVDGPVSFRQRASFLWPHHLTIGRYAYIGSDARLACWGEIVIGDDFLASDRLTLNSGSHDPETVKPHISPIRIGNRVWCGTNVTICAGVTIGDDVVIGAGSVVVKDIPGGCVAVGVPAKPLRELRRNADTPFWSSWQERSDSSNYADSGKFRQLLHRLRTHI